MSPCREECGMVWHADRFRRFKFTSESSDVS